MSRMSKKSREQYRQGLTEALRLHDERVEAASERVALLAAELEQARQTEVDLKVSRELFIQSVGQVEQKGLELGETGKSPAEGPAPERTREVKKDVHADEFGSTF